MSDRLTMFYILLNCKGKISMLSLYNLFIKFGHLLTTLKTLRTTTMTTRKKFLAQLNFIHSTWAVHSV